MNWEMVGALGELAGALGVIVSLLYLAGQITQNTRVMRRTSSHEAVQGMLNWFSHALSDPDLGFPTKSRGDLRLFGSTACEV